MMSNAELSKAINPTADIAIIMLFEIILVEQVIKT